MLLDDAGECSARKEGGRHVKIVVSFQEEMKWKELTVEPRRSSAVPVGGAGEQADIGR